MKVGDLVKHVNGCTGLVLEDGGIIPHLACQYYLVQWVDWYDLPQKNKHSWTRSEEIFEVINESR